MSVAGEELLLVGLRLGLAASSRTSRGFRARRPGPGGPQSIVPGGGERPDRGAPSCRRCGGGNGCRCFFRRDLFDRQAHAEIRNPHRRHSGRTILRYRDGGALIVLEGVENVRLSGLVLDGDAKPLDDGGALLAATETKHLDRHELPFHRQHGKRRLFEKVSGWIKDCEIGDARKAGLVSEDASGLQIAHNAVRDCGENGIVVSRSEPGEDLTIVTANRIAGIAAHSGGSQTGNGISVLRKGSVMINGNRIADCAVSPSVPMPHRIAR